MEYEELVRRAWDALGVTTDREFARALGYTKQDDSSRVGKWRNGKGAPNYDGTMRLLEAAGMLRLEEGGAEAGRAASRGRRTPDPESPEAALAALTKEIRSGFQKVGSRLDRLEKQRPAAVPRAQTKKRRVS